MTHIIMSPNLCDISYVKYNSGIFSAPEINVVNSGSCSISESGETVIYQTSNPYAYNDDCHVEFSCPDNQILSYKLNRFEIQKTYACRWDYLGISCILLYQII